MKIAVNVRFLLKNKLEGIGVFSYETLKRIVRDHPEHDFIFLFDRPFDPSFVFSKNIKAVVLPPPARHPVLWYLWFQVSVKRFLTREKPDLFVSMDGYLPLRVKTATLAVIHDIAFEHYPKDVPFLVRKYYHYFFPKFARSAARIATVSEYSKKDISNTYNIPEDQIDVVYNGAGDHFCPLDETQKAEVKKRFTNGEEYFIYVGALHQRKNISNLLRAFDRFKSVSKSSIKLMIVGRKAWGNQEMEEVYESMSYKKDVIFTGRLSDEELASALASALALTYLSYFEGFGIPLVEAMRCEIPIITSNKTSLPEVAGDAALTVDPFNIDQMADAMGAIATNVNLRNKLVRHSKERLNRFSWEKTARLLWESMEKCL